MKLDVRLIDEKENSLKGAELTIKLVFKDGKEVTLPTRTSKDRGVVPLDEFDPKIMGVIDFSKSQYQIAYGDATTPWLKLGKPIKANAGRYRYVLKAYNLSSKRTPKDSDPSKTLITFLETKDGKRLQNGQASLSFKSVQNKQYKVEPSDISQEGLATFALPILAKNISWPSIKVVARIKGAIFDSVQIGNHDKSDNGWYVAVVMQLQEGNKPISETKILNVKVDVLDKKKQPFSDVIISGGFTDLKDTEHKIPPIKISQSGKIVKWKREVFPGVAEQRKSAYFEAEIEGKKYRAIRNGPVAKQGDGYDHYLKLTINQRFANEGSSPTPGPNPKPGSWTTGNPNWPYRVEGIVTGDGGQPLSDIQVSAFHKTVGDEKELGAARTAKNGRYRIYYPPSEFGIQNVNLSVRTARGNTPLARSGLINNAGPTEQVNFSITDDTFAGIPLYTQITDDLSDIIGEGSPINLSIEDVALLADQMHQNDVVIAHYVRAWDLIEELDMASSLQLAEAFFALTAGGLHPTLNSILGTTNQRITTLLEEAIETRWIAKLDIGQIVSTLNQLRAKYFADSDSDLSRLLDAVGVAAKKKGDVIATTLGDGNETQKWSKIETIIGSTKANKLRSLIEIWRTLKKDATLTIHLYENFSVGDIKSLVAVDKNTLIDAIRVGNEMPETIQAQDKNTKIRKYADALIKLIEEQHPHDHFLVNLANSSVSNAKSIAQKMLSKPEYDLESSQSLRELASDSNLDDLANLATLYVICPMPDRYRHAEQIMSKNLLSSTEIIKSTKEKFRREMKPEMNADISNAIYDKAAHLGSMTTALSIQLPKNDPNRKRTLVGQLFADSLNGNCGHCNSSLSPSAYLLDLYRFLEKAESNDGGNGIDLLNGRRADIKELLLDCENADTLLPYIDLSNEVLEAKVLGANMSMRQTNSTAEQLRAEPANVSESAYDHLAAQTFPWSMGYDRKLDQTKSYLEHLGIDLPRLAKQLDIETNEASSINTEFTRVFLVPNPTTIALGNQVKWSANWGVNNRNLLENKPGTNGEKRDLNDLSLWLHLESSTILSIAESAFVGISGDVFESSGGIKWNSISDEKLIRMQFFGRLLLATGYSVESLDRLLQLDVIDASSANSWKREVSSIEQLVPVIDSPLEDVIALWEIAPEIRSNLLADYLGLSSAAFENLQAISNHDIELPSSVLALLQMVSVLNNYGLELYDAINLLSSPIEEHAFFSLNNEALLTKLKTGLDADASDISAQHENFVNALAQEWQLASESLKLALVKYPNLISEIQELTPGSTPLLLSQLITLNKSSWLLDKLNLRETEDLSPIESLSSDMGWPIIDNLPAQESDANFNLQGLIDLLEHKRVNDIHFGSDQSVFQLIDGAGSSSTSIVNALAQENETWSRENLSFLLGSNGFNISNKQDFLSKRVFYKCSLLLEVIDSYGGAVEDIYRAIFEHNGGAAQSLLQARFDAGEYLNVLTQLNDPIRERCQARLVEAVISQSRNKGRSKGYQNTHELYEELLIDSQMSACFETSRTKQATASLQQLIQRIMLNLESGWSFNEAQMSQWVWRKNYRVWEANRKVFLMPENWIEPELRDNKSSLFEELETELMQGDVDAERAENALLNYARGLLSLSRMEMVGSISDETSNRNHVFARSSDHPRRYYWCTRESNGLWGGWRLIDQEIEGEHILPVIFHNRVFLFWLNLSEKINTGSKEYQDRLAEIEANEEICRSDINEKNRKIEGYLDKIEEYREYAASDYPMPGMSHMWTTLADSMEDSVDAIDEEINGEGGLKDDLVSFKSQKEGVSRQFTYYECSLSWSQFSGATGWTPAKRSIEGVNSRYTREDEEHETHLNNSRQFWLLAHPHEENLDIELRCSAGNSDGNSYDYRLGLFEFDPILEKVTTQDENEAPKIIKDIHFTTLWHHGQKLHSLHVLPRLTLDIDNQDQELLSWNPDEFGISAVTQMTIGYSPSNSPFLMSYKNQSYFIEPEQPAAGKPLISASELPRLAPKSQLAKPKVANTNFQALSISATAHTIDKKAAPAFASQSNRKAARPLGRSSGRLADGRPSHSLSINGTRATSRDWQKIENVVAPSNTVAPVAGKLTSTKKWLVSVLYHPFSEIIVSELYRGGVDALYRPDAESGNENAIALERQSHNEDRFSRELNLSNSIVMENENEERFEFNRRNPYSVYNWEIFFHAPFAIAKHLTRNRKFEDAQKWLHYIFDPISKEGDTHRSVWRFQPFFNEHQRLLSGAQDEITEFAEQNYGEFEAQVAEWEQNPFNPHAIARLRTISYMRSTFINYLDNLLSWADDLFRRDSMESVAEAAQLYVQASQLLGPAPLSLPESITQKNSATLEEHHDDEEDVHPLLVASGVKLPPAEPPKNDFYSKMGKFCIPANDKIQEYWDTIADRLFKIRHCMNIEGVERTLALYQPPIDPAMLVRAAAAGLDLGAVIGDMNASLPKYRFHYMLQKAKEFTSEVKSLGGALLSALEKQDSETLSQLRSNHESVMQKRILEIKKERLEEAKTAHASLEKSLFSAMERHGYYQDLLDRGPLNSEKEEIRKIEGANTLTSAADVANVTASILALGPEIGANGFLPSFKFGGNNLSNAFSGIGSGLNARSSGLNRQAGMLARDASVVRRDMDWKYQVSQAKRDIERLEKDQIASEIRIAIAEKEIADQELQIVNSDEANTFMRGKFTNDQLYGWMVSELSTLHFQAYKLALDMAKQAEACMNFELDHASKNIIQFSYWDGMKKGLLSGEKLAQDINQLDAHYIANNHRKLELTKSVSLLRIDASKLLELKRDAYCEFIIPEYIFDLDYPGHFNRKIKSVSMTIPAISGPYANLSCELTLDRSATDLDNPDTINPLSSNSVALSSGQDDTGLFQFDLRDERYLPFEGHYVNSVWKLSLPPKTIAQFDYSTISDVILTINYTAKNDPDKRIQKLTALNGTNFGESEFGQLLSLKGQFSNLWHQIVSNTDNLSTNPIQLSFERHNFPYLASTRGVTLKSLQFATLDHEGNIGALSAKMDITSGALLSDSLTVNVEEDWAITTLETASNYRDIYLLVNYQVG